MQVFFDIHYLSTSKPSDFTVTSHWIVTQSWKLVSELLFELVLED